MISPHDLYTVLSALVPLYVAMFLAFGSVRWWKIFTPVQCSGINRFVAVFAVPLLSFHFISTNNPYKMDCKFLLADTISKLAVLALLGLWAKLCRSGSLDWMITLFAVATLPNTLVMGIPMLTAMYGGFYGGLMVQLVVLQCIIWYTLMLFLFEYRAARLLVMEQFPDNAASIISFKVDSDVVSLDGREPLQTQADVGDDGKIRVTIRRSTSSRSQALNGLTASPRRSMGLGSMPSSKAITPRPSNLTGAEIYSVYSSRNNTPREYGGVNHHDIHSMMYNRPGSPTRQSNFTCSDVYSVQSSRGPTPRASNVNEDNYKDFHVGSRGLNSPRMPLPPYGGPASHAYGRSQAPNGISAHNHENTFGGVGQMQGKVYQTAKKMGDPKASPKVEDDGKELHMFVWSSTASPISEGGLHISGGNDSSTTDATKPTNDHKEVRMQVQPLIEPAANGDLHEPLNPPPSSAPYVGQDFSFGSRAKFPGEMDSCADKHRQSTSKAGVGVFSTKVQGAGKAKEMPPAPVLAKLILCMVGRKLLQNPNTYSSLLGIIWSLIAFKWNVAMPKMIAGSISLLSDAGLGMAMFSLGLFMALQPRLIACGTRLAIFAMAIRFLSGPAIMATASIVVGLRGVDLHAAIVQAALPQGIVPFVFAREYDLHPDILSTAVIFGMLVALPTTIAYYVLLGL